MEDTFNTALAFSIAGATFIAWVVHKIKKMFNVIFNFIFIGAICFGVIVYADKNVAQSGLTFLKKHSYAFAANHSENQPPLERVLTSISPYIYNVKMKDGKVIFKGIDSDVTGEIVLEKKTTIRLTLQSKLNQDTVALTKKILVAFSGESSIDKRLDAILKSPGSATIQLTNGKIQISDNVMVVTIRKPVLRVNGTKLA